MYCSNCGNSFQANEKFCSNCGHPREMHPGNQAHQYGSGQHVQTQETSSAALVCGILSLFFFGLVLGIIAIVLAKRPESRNKTAARVTGTIGIIGWTIGIIIYIIAIIAAAEAY